MNKISLEDFDIIYMEIYNRHDITIDETKKSYDSWIKYQEYVESVSNEEKNKYKYVIWNDFPTAESWILHEKDEREKESKRHEAYQKYMKLPWYEKILMEDGDCKIKNNIIEAFIVDDNGKKLMSELCLWNIESQNMFSSIKHFTSFVTDRKITDDEINTFLNQHKDLISEWGFGVCQDSSRVLRTLKWVCQLFYKEMV